MTTKEALGDYKFRLRVQAELGCSMNTITSALQGKPTRHRLLREYIVRTLKRHGVRFAK